MKQAASLTITLLPFLLAMFTGWASAAVNLDFDSSACVVTVDDDDNKQDDKEKDGKKRDGKKKEVEEEPECD
jgi:hypothetical protein